jgi:hypothetical protein
LSPRGYHASAPCHKGADRQRLSAVRAAPSPRFTSRAPILTASSPVSEADHVAVRARHRRCPVAFAVANSSTVSGAPSPPLAAFLRGLLSRASSPPPPRRRTAAGHRSPHLVGERRRRSSFPPSPSTRNSGGPRALCPRAEPALWTWATRYCATGPSVDSAQWHLIIFLYFLNIFNYLQIQKFV